MQLLCPHCEISPGPVTIRILTGEDILREILKGKLGVARLVAMAVWFALPCGS